MIMGIKRLRQTPSDGIEEDGVKWFTNLATSTGSGGGSGGGRERKILKGVIGLNIPR